MAKKTVRQKARPAARRRATKKPPAKRNPAAANATCYVTVSPPAVSIHRSKPNGGSPAGPCHSVEAAKSAALDGLIAAIEEAERKLAACKRATTIEQLRSL